ncbi:hypothetical protein IKG02_03185 [Candidatus Saccharibacteria bacterium]|nr:hypothetical protein [Candidatus Saccharibacteria bacterium]
MVNSKQVIASLGVVAGLGASLMPLTTYAADPQEVTHVVRTTVAEVFTLTVDSNTEIEKDNTTSLDVDKATVNTTLVHTANVKGNLYGGYNLKLSSASASTDLVFVKDSSKAFGNADRYDTNIKIPTGTGVAAGTSAWAYKSSETAGSFTGDWTTIKASGSGDTLKTNTNASNGSFDDKVYVNFGISASESQIAGMYEGEVKYVATPQI